MSKIVYKIGKDYRDMRELREFKALSNSLFQSFEIDAGSKIATEILDLKKSNPDKFARFKSFVYRSKKAVSNIEKAIEAAFYRNAKTSDPELEFAPHKFFEEFAKLETILKAVTNAFVEGILCSEGFDYILRLNPDYFTKITNHSASIKLDETLSNIKEFAESLDNPIIRLFVENDVCELDGKYAHQKEKLVLSQLVRLKNSGIDMTKLAELKLDEKTTLVDLAAAFCGQNVASYLMEFAKKDFAYGISVAELSAITEDKLREFDVSLYKNPDEYSRYILDIEEAEREITLDREEFEVILTDEAELAGDGDDLFVLEEEY